MSTAKPNPPVAPARPIAKPKAMSSKLLTMKFMQRSAASSTSRTDTLAVREALVQESAKRDAALQASERSGSTASADAETRWELSYVKKIDGTRRTAVVDWGYGEVVGDDGNEAASSLEPESESEAEQEQDHRHHHHHQQQGMKNGRMVFGKFRSKAEPVKTGDKDADSDSDAAEVPKKKNVSLRGLTSISNSGAPAPEMVCRGCQKKGHTQARCPQAKCYACDGKGHMSMDCPNKGTKRRQPMGFNSKDNPKRRRSGGY